MYTGHPCQCCDNSMMILVILFSLNSIEMLENEFLQMVVSYTITNPWLLRLLTVVGRRRNKWHLQRQPIYCKISPHKSSFSFGTFILLYSSRVKCYQIILLYFSYKNLQLAHFHGLPQSTYKPSSLPFLFYFSL